MAGSVRHFLLQIKPIWLLTLFCAAFSVASAQESLLEEAIAAEGNARCYKCHGDFQLIQMTPETLAGMVRIPPDQTTIFRDPGKIEDLFLPQEIFDGSAHSDVKCVECHLGIELLPHNQRLATLACGDCHGDVEKNIAMGPHSPAISDGQARPSCVKCHDEPHETAALTQPRSYEKALSIVQTCVECHEEAGEQRFHPAQDYVDSIHGRGLFKLGLSLAPTCVECHGSHLVLPEADLESPVNPRNSPETCGECHQGVVDVYFGSVHGQNLLAGEENAASCTSCHSSHGVREVDRKFLTDVVQECSDCHLELGETYLISYHGKAVRLGGVEAAVCSSCHGSHEILPPSDPESRVAQGNLIETCSECHENVNENFVKYMPHVDYTDPKGPPQVFFTWLIMMTVLLGTLCAFIPHSLLWFQRTLIGRLLNPMGHHLSDFRHKGRMIRRFHPVHRVTHALIVISFMGLVATGFPLKYSHTEWAQQLAGIFGGVHVMGILHRILAVITFVYAGIHVVFLTYFFIFKCPKPRLRFLFGPDSMLPSWRDVKDAFAMIRWFFWLGPRPRLDRWAYFEKFDYFGEIWGVFVIGGTGLLLWVPHLFTRWLPGWILNCATVVHSIEALLAASVIFLVHFFNTHLRPEKFPVDMVMFTGQMSEGEMKEERGAEYSRLVAEGTLEERVEKPVGLPWRIFGGLLGILAFLTGISLIVLAIRAEINQYFR